MSITGCTWRICRIHGVDAGVSAERGADGRRDVGRHLPREQRRRRGRLKRRHRRRRRYRRRTSLVDRFQFCNEKLFLFNWSYIRQVKSTFSIHKKLEPQSQLFFNFTQIKFSD